MTWVKGNRVVRRGGILGLSCLLGLLVACDWMVDECQDRFIYPEEMEVKQRTDSDINMDPANLEVGNDSSVRVTFDLESPFTLWTRRPDTSISHPVIQRLRNDTTNRLVVLGRKKVMGVENLRLSRQQYNYGKGKYYRKLKGTIPEASYDSSENGLAMMVTEARMPQLPDYRSKIRMDRDCIQDGLRKHLKEKTGRSVTGSLSIHSLGHSGDTSRWLVVTQVGDTKTRHVAGEMKEYAYRWVGVVDHRHSEMRVRYAFSFGEISRDEPDLPTRYLDHHAVDRDGDGVADMVMVQLSYGTYTQPKEILWLNRSPIEHKWIFGG